jgi:hypothetical protein
MMLRDNKQCNNSNLNLDEDLETEIEGLEPIHRKVWELFLGYNNELTVQEISEVEPVIDTETLSRCLSELHKKRLIYTGDEQREDSIWRTRYFLRSEIQESNDTKVV